MLLSSKAQLINSNSCWTREGEGEGKKEGKEEGKEENLEAPRSVVYAKISESGRLILVYLPGRSPYRQVAGKQPRSYHYTSARSYQC